MSKLSLFLRETVQTAPATEEVKYAKRSYQKYSNPGSVSREE